MTQVRRIPMRATGSIPGPRAGTVPVWSLLLPVLASLLLLLIAGQRPDGRLHVWVLDVGQGDSILLRTPAGHTALIDGGPGATSLLNEAGEHLPFWQRNIDLVVLTHPHEDHLMGLVELAGRYTVGQVVQTEFTATQGVQAEWLRLLSRKAIPVHYARRGESISFEGEPGLTVRVLSPATTSAAREQREGGANNASIVLRVEYAGHSVLLEGDAQASAEASMLAYDAADLKSEVLKVAHHGSTTSSSISFLRAVKPAVAVISVGEGNKLGHPAPETVDGLQQVGARIFRTDQNGTVELIMDRDHLWARSVR